MIPLLLREALLRSEALKLNCLCVCVSVCLSPFSVRFMLAGRWLLHMSPSFGVLICPNFRNPEKSAHKLALRFESSTFEDPILDHFLDTFFEHFPQKWRFAPPACGLLSSSFLQNLNLTQGSYSLERRQRVGTRLL